MKKRVKKKSRKKSQKKSEKAKKNFFLGRGKKRSFKKVKEVIFLDANILCDIL